MTIALSGTQAASEAVTEDGIVRKVAWRCMPLIMICYMFAFFDRINISFAKFQLQSDLGFSNVAYGLGHNPADDVWRDADTGRAIADTAQEALDINEDTDATVYRALPARIHNLVLYVLDEHGREDDHGRTPRSVLDDSPIRPR